MRNYLKILILMAMVTSFACTGEQKPSSPLETFKTYTKAIKKKDTTTMKLLLSSETLKAHEQEAKVMGTTVDDIVKRESLVSEMQTSVEFRNERIDGERATLEVKNVGNRWETVFFVFEGGEWKIDKKGSADQLLREIEEQNRQADENYNAESPLDNPHPTRQTDVTPQRERPPSREDSNSGGRDGGDKEK